MESAAALNGFAALSASSALNGFAGKTVKLGADVTLNDDMSNPENTFRPIGTGEPFQGTFDGQNHTISGLYVYGTAANSGLFGAVGANGVVMNLSLTDSKIESTASYTGAIAGTLRGTLRNVYSDATVKNSAGYLGGLVGLATGDAVMEKCWFAGTVENIGKTAQVTGGLAGYADNAGGAGTLLMRNCLSAGTVDVTACEHTSQAAAAGGLIGMIGHNTTVTVDACLCSGEILYDEEKVAYMIDPLTGRFHSDQGSSLVVSRYYALDWIDSLPSTGVYSSDFLVKVSASEILGNKAASAMPMLDWGTDWKCVAGSLPVLDLMQSGTAKSYSSLTADTSRLTSVYASRTLLQGELHEHADTSVGTNDGTSDGYVELDQWYPEMTTLGMDFAASLDHRQASHIDLPYWDKSKLVYGTEAAMTVQSLDGSDYEKFHFDMIFKTKEDLVSVLSSISGFNYGRNNGTVSWENRGNNGAAEFAYLYFLSRSSAKALVQAVQNAGGFFVMPHPFTYADNNGISAEYYFGVDGTGFQVLYGDHTYDDRMYAGWKELLKSGAKMYACAGSDTHRDLTLNALTSVYSTSAAATDKGEIIDQLRAGDFTAGSVGIKMCVGTTAMGGTTSFSSKRVVIDVEKFHTQANDLTHKYRLDVITDDGVVYSKLLTVDGSGNVAGTETAFDADASASFYRAVVVDVTTGKRVAIGNPIWNN